MGIKLREIDASLPDVELTPSLMAKMMLFKMFYIFLIFLVGCFIVVAYDFISSGFSIYDAGSTLTIAAIFALFSGIEMLLLISKKMTPIALIMIGLASPFILLKRLHFQNIIRTTPERMIGYVLPYGLILIYKHHAGVQTKL
ncbi:MAG: hypothetical protein KAW47_02555 [Thermoplasmatales archaeon]|nr:hypothetical protein [Thermoplasmatales archaeon]